MAKKAIMEWGHNKKPIAEIWQDILPTWKNIISKQYGDHRQNWKLFKVYIDRQGQMPKAKMVAPEP